MGYQGDDSISCDVLKCLDGLLALLQSPNMVVMTTVVSCVYNSISVYRVTVLRVWV